MKNKNKLLFSFIGTLSFLLFCFGFALSKISFFVVSQKIAFCQTAIQSFRFEILPCDLQTIILMTAGLLFAVLLARTLFAAYRLYMFKKQLFYKKLSYNQISLILKKHRLIEDVIVVKDNKLFAFCFGIINPKIYISTSFIKAMNKKELEAVLLHEKYHLQNKDSLVLFIGAIVKIAFPFFPIISDMFKKYKIEREILADKQAINFLTTKEPLLSALRKLLVNQPVAYSFVASISGETLEERITLLTKGNKKTKTYHVANLLVSLLFILLFAVVIVVPVNAKQIRIDKNSALLVSVNGTSINAVCATSNAIDKENYSENAKASFVNQLISLPVDK